MLNAFCILLHADAVQQQQQQLLIIIISISPLTLSKKATLLFRRSISFRFYFTHQINIIIRFWRKTIAAPHAAYTTHQSLLFQFSCQFSKYIFASLFILPWFDVILFSSVHNASIESEHKREMGTQTTKVITSFIFYISIF